MLYARVQQWAWGRLSSVAHGFALFGVMSRGGEVIHLPLLKYDTPKKKLTQVVQENFSNRFWAFWLRSGCRITLVLVRLWGGGPIPFALLLLLLGYLCHGCMLLLVLAKRLLGCQTF